MQSLNNVLQKSAGRVAIIYSRNTDSYHHLDSVKWFVFFKKLRWVLHHSPVLPPLKETPSKSEVKDTSSCQVKILKVTVLITAILRKFRCSDKPKSTI